MDIKGILNDSFSEENKSEEEKRKKRKMLLLLLIILLLLVAISSCGVGVLLNKYISKDYIGGFIELTPDKHTSAQYLMLSGKVVYKDGSPATGMPMELHSSPKYATTDGNGFFTFMDVETGKHVISALDETGNVIASREVDITMTEGGETSIKMNADGTYSIELSVALQLLEIEIELDKDAKQLFINQERFDTVDSDGTYKNPAENVEYTPKPGSGEYVVTPTNTVVLPGGTIVLPGNNNGSRKPQVILPDGSTPDDSVLPQLGLKRLADGSIQLPGKVVSDITGQIVMPDGTKADPGKSGILIDSDKLKDDKNKKSDKKDSKNSKNGTTTVNNGKKSNGENKVNSDGNNSGENNSQGGNKNPDGNDNQGGNDNPGENDSPGGNDNPGGNEESGEYEGSGGGNVSGGGFDFLFGKLKISSLSGTKYVAWTQNANIDVFHSEDGKERVIEPGSEGTFNFQLKNGRSRKINVVLTITEPENGKHLPLLFDLKDKDANVISDAVCLNNGESLTMEFSIKSKKTNTYSLHWIWSYSGNDDAYDTLMGNLGGQYILNVVLYAEEVK